MNKENKDFSLKAERNFKDTLFRRVFQEPKELLQLYNAVNGTNYVNVEDLEIVTLENAIYLSMKNDVAFVIGYNLNMYEQQASINPNMPMRYLQYVAKEYGKLIVHKTLYSNKLIKVPTPNFIVFYNGVAPQPERLEMKLSDAFETQVENPALELRVVQLNINVGCNKELMNKCKTLEEYSIYVEKVRKYTSIKPLTDAVEQAIEECISEGILSELLSKYRAEVVSMSILECTWEKEEQLIREAEREIGWELGRKDGLEIGIQEGITEGIKVTIELCKEMGLSKEKTMQKVKSKFSLSKQDIEKYLNDFWK